MNGTIFKSNVIKEFSHTYINNYDRFRLSAKLNVIKSPCHIQNQCPKSDHDFKKKYYVCVGTFVPIHIKDIFFLLQASVLEYEKDT